jgi:hypothetical protein
MNHYGAMARDHWARWLPARYAAITDPDSFFSDLGTRVSDQIGQLAQELAGDDPPGESYLVKVGRLGAARRQAEEIVLPAEVLLPPEPAADETEDETENRLLTNEPWGLDFLYQDQDESAG